MTYTYGELHRQLTLALREFPDNATVTVHMSRDAGEKLAEAVMLADGVQTWYDTAAEKVRVAYEAMRPLIDALTAPQDPPLICEACGVPFDTMLELNAHAFRREGPLWRTHLEMHTALKGTDALPGYPCRGLAARGQEEAGFTAGRDLGEDTWRRARARILKQAQDDAERLHAPEEDRRSPKPHPGTYKADD